MSAAGLAVALGVAGMGFMSGNREQEQDIIGAVNTLFLTVDSRDWDGVEGCFAGQVLLDYSSMGGGRPAIVSPREITGAWRGFLPGFTSTHHLVTGYRVTFEGDEAETVSARAGQPTACPHPPVHPSGRQPGPAIST